MRKRSLTSTTRDTHPAPSENCVFAKDFDAVFFQCQFSNFVNFADRCNDYLVTNSSLVTLGNLVETVSYFCAKFNLYKLLKLVSCDQ